MRVRAIARMSPEQRIVAARRIMLDAALSMTRLTPRMRLAVKLILLQGRKPARVARDKRVSSDRRLVHRALLTAKARLAQIEDQVTRRLSGPGRDKSGA